LVDVMHLLGNRFRRGRIKAAARRHI
jgi:hypothetical protein